MEIGDRIKTEQYSPYHSMIYIRDNIVGVESNITDIGYGASQVLPVLAACLQFSQSLLVVEQPEIHLHPKAQGTVAEVLCETSKNRQVIVETHSPHMINRARIMVANGSLPARDVLINYVYRDETGSHVKEIPILENGDFGDEWPSGFFDERYEDTMTLLHLKSEKS